MKMGSLGYTIIEVMIFLAVSGLMFVLAATFINGKQSNSEFKQSMNNINSEVNQVVNDVSDGFYNNDNDISCSTSGGTLIISAGTNGQGTNGGVNGSGLGGCVFLGKVLQFGVNSDATKYNVYTVAGSQYSSSDPTGPNLPANFATADPTAVDNGSINITEYNTFEWGSSVTKMFNAKDPSETYSGIGFFGNFSNYGQSNNLASGSASSLAVPFGGTTGENESTMLNNINNGSYYDANIATNLDIDACFYSGGSEYGVLTIGGVNGQRLTSSFQIYTTKAEWNSVGCS